jgi:hypothetical protein
MHMPAIFTRQDDPSITKAAVITVAVFLTFLVLYVATLLPDVLPADAGEFQLVATKAGVAHPPGYPLHTMLGWIFTQLPLGPSPAWRASVLSAVTAAAAVAVVYRAGLHMSGSVWGGVAAAVALGSATTVWATATSASIRPLMLLFTALCMYSASRFAAASRESMERAGGWLVVFAASLSLGLTHHPALVFVALVCACYILSVDPTLVRQPRRWLKPLLAFLLGLVALLYLPLRSAAGAVLAPTDLTTVQGFLNHFLARGFSSDLFAFSVGERIVVLPTLLTFQFNCVIPVIAAAGAVILISTRRWREGALLVGSFILHTAVSLTYRAPQTVEYLMPAYVPLTILLAIPVGWAEQVAKASTRLPHWRAALYWAARVAVVGTCLASLVTHSPSYLALSESHDAREYAEAILSDAPDGAAILANWHWVTPLWYIQQVEGVRPDIEVIYVFPRTESAAQDWIAEIEENIARRPVVVTRYFEQEYAQLPYRFEPLHEAFLVRDEPRTASPGGLTPLPVTLGGTVELEGYALDEYQTQPSRPLVLTMAWSAAVAQETDLAFFAQLIGSDGRLWSAARDVHYAANGVSAGEVLVERFAIYPFLHAAPGQYELVVGAYLPGEPGAPRLTTEDGADTVGIASVTITPATIRPVTKHSGLARFATSPALLGVDYDTGVAGQLRTYLHWSGPTGSACFQLTDDAGDQLGQGCIPELERGEYATVAVDTSRAPAGLVVLDGGPADDRSAVPASPIRLPAPVTGERYLPLGDVAVLHKCSLGPAQPRPGDLAALGLMFEATRPVERDYVVSVALTGSNPDGTWAWRKADDTVPALITVPTLKWIRGSLVFDPHRIEIPADASILVAVGSLGVYDHFTQAPLPALDERLSPVVLLGSWTLGTQ